MEPSTGPENPVFGLPKRVKRRQAGRSKPGVLSGGRDPRTVLGRSRGEKRTRKIPKKEDLKRGGQITTQDGTGSERGENSSSKRGDEGLPS